MNPFLALFAKAEYENLSPEEFENKLKNDKNAVLVDVRTKEENKDYRIPKSKLADISSISFKTEIEKIDKSKSIYVYCASGARSRSACNMIKKMGYEKVYNLSGGICSWKGKIER
jgi:rhodanese-related sulfurtransferase